MKPPRLLLCALLLGSLVVPPVTLAATRNRDVPAPIFVGAPDFDLPAVQLRITLSRALGEHAFILVEAMRTSARPGPEFDAAAAALDQNTADIEGIVGRWLTEEEASAFGQQWRNHIAYLVDYGRAVADGDADAARLAETQLEAYSDEFSALLTDALPNLPRDAVEQLVGEHVSQLEQVTDLAEGDYESAYTEIRNTYAHMFAIADGLVVGFAGRHRNELDGMDTAFSPAVDMRMTLDRLFGEHTYLAGTVMRAHVAGDPHRAAAVDALGQNSSALGEQVSRIYGEDGGEAFEDLWTRHTSLYVEYVNATAAGDTSAREESLAGLAQYRSDFSAFLADANRLIDAGALEAMLEAHTTHLVDQVGAYVDEDYDQAFAMLRDGYAQTEELASGLGGAIADQFPRLFPDTAVSKGALEGIRVWLVAVGIALLGWAAGVAMDRARGQSRGVIGTR